MQNKYILSTAPVTESILRESEDMGIYIDVVSFIETREIEDEAVSIKIKELAKKEIVAIFTSKVAVGVVEKYITSPAKWKIYCVGEVTEKYIRKDIGNNIHGSENNASALAEIIIEDNVKNVIFFCGDIHREELPVKLKEAGIGVEEIVVYKTVETPHPIVKKYDGILFFSPSAVRSYFKLNSVLLLTNLFAIGSTTADEIKKYSNNDIIIADKPGKKELVKLMTEYYKHQAC